MGSALVRMLALVLFLLNSTVALAAEIIVLSSNASRSAVSELGPIFEKATGHKAAIQFANNPILKQKIEAGAKFDVLIIEPFRPYGPQFDFHSRQNSMS